MKGKLIIIEAGDGCGKETQTNLLVSRLKAEGKAVRKVSFPDYKSESSALVKMYLNGQFGREVNAVNAYAASTFYAVDRYASYKRSWEKDYLNGSWIISDRYTTSNMVHQAVKLHEKAEREEYLTWLCDLEYKRLGIPVPDMVIFLDMQPSFSSRLIAERAARSGQEKDIHEADAEYLSRCYEAYRELAQRYGWQTVPCTMGSSLKSIEQIHEEIYELAGTVE